MQDPTEKHVSDVGILDKYNNYYYYYYYRGRELDFCTFPKFFPPPPLDLLPFVTYSNFTHQKLIKYVCFR
jgi:hypothetical protein